MKWFSKSSTKETVKKIRSRHILLRIIILCLSLLISAIVFNLFQLPTHIVSGGSNGIAIIVEHIWGWSPSLVILVINSLLLALSLFSLGIEATGGAVIATFIYPLLVDWTSHIGNFVVVDTNDMILVAIVVGLLTGLTKGINYKIGFNGGGFDIINQVLFKWMHISIGKTSLTINAIIVILGGFYFGWTMVLYSIIVVWISSITMDHVLLGISKSKEFYIITTEEEQVKAYILNEIKHGVTVFNAQGGFLEKRKHVLMTVVPTQDYFKLTTGVKEIDPDAFFVVIDAYESSVQKELLKIEEIGIN